MKKLLALLTILILTSCIEDEYSTPIIVEKPTETLFISEASGLKLESYIVTSQVKINTKFENDGTYRIKIYNFDNKLVSQEKIEATQGDNILNIYVSSLPKDSYTVKLQTINHEDIGIQLFSKN